MEGLIKAKKVRWGSIRQVVRSEFVLWRRCFKVPRVVLLFSLEFFEVLFNRCSLESLK